MQEKKHGTYMSYRAFPGLIIIKSGNGWLLQEFRKHMLNMNFK